MNLIEAFEQNLIKGLNTAFPDKTMETIVSKLFFYGDKVFKIYKYEEFFFGNFASFEFRKEFYFEDFDQNRLMAPDVYLFLRGVKGSGDIYKLAELSDAGDFFIEMKKFDDNKNLTNLLLNNKISKNELSGIAKEMVLRLKKLTESKKEKYKNYFDKKLIDIHLEDLESDRNLLYLIPDSVPKEKTDKIIDSAKRASAENSYYRNYDSKNLSVLIDNHADNIVLFQDKIQLIDVLPPKESWRVGDLNFVICRLATDAAVLGSEELADIVYASCEPMPEKIRSIYEIRIALIQTWCFYSVNKPDIAQKYLRLAGERALESSPKFG